jgi:predicted ATPase/class 3 adenylate cyclase
VLTGEQPMSEQQQIEAALSALEAQRGLLGDAVVAMAAAPLRARLDTLLAQQAATVQQLRQVTVLFIDTVGSTAMGRHLAPEDIHAVMDGALARYTAAVQAQRGRVLQYTGDGLLAAFGGEQTQEDDAERAVRAALAILDESRRVADEVQALHGIAGYGVRAGIATGPVLLGGGVDAEGSIRGATVNMAARMEQTAPVGGLRIHHDTYRHVRGVFRVSAEPPLMVKGSDEPVTTYLVQGVKPRAFRVVSRGIEGVETRMVAREAELETLQDSFRELQGASAFITVSVVGEAGLGKSRLLYEFENWAEAHGQDYLLFRGRAEPQTQTQPFALLHDLLAWRLQIADDDPAELARAKLVDGLLPLFGPGGEAQVHLLGQLIGLDFSASPHVRGILDDARQIRNRGFHAAAQVLRLMAQTARLPVLLLLDDLQWADDGSLDFLQYLAQVNRDAPTLMLFVTRPSLFERRPDLRLLLDAARDRIDLEPLDKRGSRELVGVLLQRLAVVPAALRDLLISGAEGNPFYMEELVRMLIDDGAIRTQDDPWAVVPERLLSVNVPSTLTGVLQARLDGLPAAEKRTLQLAAVVGFVLWEQALLALDPTAAETLPRLVQRGLLVPREHPSVQGQAELAFKHQILHQVTYDSQLRRQQREAHARVAAWLAQFSADRAAETLGLAAEHFERAGDRASACSYYTRAAEDAAARFANRAMRGFAERALALAAPDDHATRWRVLLVRERHLLYRDDRAAHAADLQALAAAAEGLDDDACRAQVALRHATAHRTGGDYAAAVAAAQRALVLARPLQQPRLVVRALHALADSLVGQGDYAQAQRVCTEGLALAREAGHRIGESKLVNALGVIAMDQGDLALAIVHFEQGLAMVREIGDPDDEGVRLSNLGSCCSRLGDYAAARQHLDAALQLARQTGQRATEALVLLNIASAAHLQGDATGALAYARAAHQAAVASAQADLQAFAHLVAGHAELALGRFEAAAAAYAQSRDELLGLNIRSQQVLDPVSGLARVALAQGRLDEALRHTEPLLAHMAEGGHFDGTEEPLLLPLTAWRVLDARGDPRAAEVLQEAVVELQALASRLSDERARSDFLERVPHHRELMRAWARHGSGAVAVPQVQRTEKA